MATSNISSDSSAEYAIPPEEFLIKLRKNLDGVALSHNSLDNNWEVLRRTLNNVIKDLDEVTLGDLDSVTTENLFVNKIADDVIDTSHIKDDAINGEKIENASIVTAHIQSQQITTDLIADNSITTAKISLAGLNLSEGITVNGVQVVDEAGNITGPVSLSSQQMTDLKGERGAAFTYSDFKQTELDSIIVQVGADYKLTFAELSDEQKAELVGPVPTFTFSDGVLTITNVI